MAGMFYSLQEAAEKLNKTEDELKQLVKEGRLREFRDGSNLLFKVDEVEGLMSDEDIIGLEEAPEAEFAEAEAPEIDFAEAEIPGLEAAAPELGEEMPEFEAEVPELGEEELSMAEPTEAAEPAADTDEILLAPETGTPAASSELTDADTALTGLGTSVLGEADKDYEVTDDTMAETAIPTGTAGTTAPEVPLEQIEEDVNLDTFGSGSGLLDLSLQADDTSLGGVLDEIYTAEGGGAEPSTEAEGEEAPAAAGIEPEQMISEDELAAPQPAAEAMALAGPIIETAPDAQSNMLGMLLFLPLLIVVYTAVVAVAGLRGVMPSILAGIQGFIWYIMGGAAVLALLVTGAAFLLTGERSAAPPKEKKAKPPKPAKEPKAPKLKAAKKGKGA
jgi:excisionase family DNA binding protein